MASHTHNAVPGGYDIYAALATDEYELQLARTALPPRYNPSSSNNTVQVREAAQLGTNGEAPYWDF